MILTFNRLENVGDVMRDRVLTELFVTAKDPITVIKWEDIYQDAETCWTFVKTLSTS